MTYLLRETLLQPLSACLRRGSASAGDGAGSRDHLLESGDWEWRQLRACPRSRSLGLFALLYLVIPGTMEFGWVPQLIGRFADPVGFFLLSPSCGLAGSYHYGCRWAVLPALVVTLDRHGSCMTFWLLLPALRLE